MFRILLILATVFTNIVCFGQADSWRVDPAHSAAQFSVRHLGISTVRGAFTKLAGSAVYSPSASGKSSIDVTIQANSVDTRVEMRDNDLRGPNFLDVNNYPTITFRSNRVDTAGAGKLKITGDLTIRGVTKQVILDADGPSTAVKDPKGNWHMGASATAKINRKDFGVNGAPAMVGDEVSLVLDVELIKESTAAAVGSSQAGK